MRISALGYDPHLPGIDRLAFADAASIVDYDAVIWDPAGLAAEYRDEHTALASDGLGPLLSVRASSALLSDARRRREEFRRLLDRGRILLVNPPPREGLRIHIIEDIVAFDPMETMPVAPRRTAPAPGDQVVFRGGHPFRAFAEAAGYRAPARTAFENFSGEPLFFGSASGRVMGGYVYHHPGHVLFLPLPDPADAAASQRIHAALPSLIEKIESHSTSLALPDWAASYRIDGEDDARAAMRALMAEREGLGRRIEAARHRLREIEFRKALFAGGGTLLVQAVAGEFQRLGAVVLPGLLSDDSIVVEHGSRCAVVLVVEGEGGAEVPERMAATLARFTADFSDTAKGIVIHTRAQPPENGDLADEMLAKRLAAQGHGYLTGLDLIRATGDVAAPQRAAAAFDLVFSAVGRPRALADRALSLRRSIGDGEHREIALQNRSSAPPGRPG